MVLIHDADSFVPTEDKRWYHAVVHFLARLCFASLVVI